MDAFDTIIVGAGIVGSAIAYGLCRNGQNVLAIDGADSDFRAARANFGLVWSQGKGRGMPAYQHLTRHSCDLWPAFLEELRDNAGGAPLDYEQRGGLAFCLGEQGFEDRAASIADLDAERLADDPNSGASDVEMLERDALQALLPNLRLGNRVSGASFGRRDGHANPLQLLEALHRAIGHMGGQIRTGEPASVIRPQPGGGFAVHTASGVYRSERIVLAAGVASSRLGRELGLDIPIRAQRGQVLVTQRLAPVLPFPCSGLRQTREGTIMIGATKEEVGEDTSATTRASAWLSRKTVEIAPALSSVQLVRHWSGLRILSPDGCPTYAQSDEYPGAFVASCHSGVTLAATHAQALATHIAAGVLPDAYQPFHHRRFDVQTAG